ncbi:hypothetical protein G4G28_08655 [Massilia sp. Dwa41.01b]|uniref:NHL domain-containing protein n=1 Tax=unclassified Massilia TaxID=2609279 RepID=UPI0016046428|nr:MULTISPECIES: hypothetical protein [unclassified Massilia]QNA88542.1 hypothetical protein G4G28_08655 [Massilia sp. Dwa41.01b]QNA99440.1 hypothetical protein G4G31_12315 [Massilia sp. Se16.2.3]
MRGIEILCNPASASVVQSGMAVTTFAGYPGSQGEGDGKLTDATFACPFGVALDDADNVYVTDAQGESVRKISPAGIVSTLANPLDSPGGIARDASGNLYVASTRTDKIFQISPSGALSSTAVREWGGATVLPVGVAIDGAGNTYVVGRGTHAIYKFSPGGAASVFAGGEKVEGSADGTGAAARFKLPFGVAIDPDGNVFVSDEGNHTIRKITPAEVVTTVAGAAGVEGASDGSAATARFSHPAGVTIGPGGNLYVVDNGNRTIRMITPDGVVSTVAGTALATGAADGYGAAASFSDPYGIVADKAGALYVTDCGNHTIRKLIPSIGTRTVSVTPPPMVFAETGTVTTLAGKLGEGGSVDGTGEFARIWSDTMRAMDPDGYLLLAEGYPTHALRKVSKTGVVSTITRENNANDTLAYPAFTFDPAGNMYTAKRRPGGSVEGLTRRDTSGNVTTIYAEVYGAPGLGRIVADGFGNVYGIDGDQIDRITVSPVSATVFAGTTASFAPRYHFDGPGPVARFQSPSGIVVDTEGNVFVTDAANLVIRKISPDGVVSTFAGKVGRSGTAPGYHSAVVDGTADAARFYYPQGLAIDGQNNLYVIDNHTIRKITPNREVRTIAGLAGVKGFADGMGAAARFSRLDSIVVDKEGTIYVGDNNTIRKIVQK